MISIHLPTSLRKYADGAVSVDVKPGSVDAALRELAQVHPDLAIRLFDDQGRFHPHLAVILGDEEVPRSELAHVQLEPGDSLTLLVAVSGGAEDVRMRGFRDRVSVEVALEAALLGVSPLPFEPVPLAESLGRVLAEPVVSGVDVPAFRRATMDGFAVQSSDTHGASTYGPVTLTLVGASMPGAAEVGSISAGEALRIMTGAPLPEGADAVLRAEDARESRDRVEVTAPVATGKNVGKVGEDVRTGAQVLPAIRRLLPQDLGLLAAIGIDRVMVHRRPRVRIVVSGDELVAPGERPSVNQIVDSNSPMLAALVARDGGVAEVVRLPDDEESMRRALKMEGADIVVTAGAASVGSEDRVPMLVDELGDLLVHGVAMRPSSPTGVGRIDAVPVILTPGNPVSCLVAYDFFAAPVIRRLGGLPVDWPYRSVRLPLRTRIVSQIGRTDYARVTVRESQVEPLAISGASILSSVTLAHGFVIVPSGLEGYAEGSEVEVHLYGDSMLA